MRDYKAAGNDVNEYNYLAMSNKQMYMNLLTWCANV